MSKYDHVNTKMKMETLIQVLDEMKVPYEVSNDDDLLKLIGYRGDKRRDKADIVIRRKVVDKMLSGGSSNDIGFLKTEDGTVSVIVSDYDKGIPKVKEFLKQVRQNCTLRELRDNARRNRYIIKETRNDDGTITLTLRR